MELIKEIQVDEGKGRGVVKPKKVGSWLKPGTSAKGERSEAFET